LYSEEFIDKYIGQENIESDKKTELYISFHNSIMNEEEKLLCVLDIVKHQYIDKTNIEEILSQVHLLNRKDIFAILISDFSEKVAKYFAHLLNR
jgi:hypothetical protein